MTDTPKFETPFPGGNPARVLTLSDLLKAAQEARDACLTRRMEG